ncbi:MAG: hypothetical protein Q7S49_00410 [bacterium]|nr:hypothetical protein [bacterium]
MKRLAPVLLLAIIIPQVAFAAWWNPFSWFDSWSFIRTDTEKEALEERVKELEGKLKEAPSQTSVATSTDATTQITPSSKKDSNTSGANNPSIKLITPITSPQTQPVTTNISKNSSYSDIVKNYKDFRSVIASEQSQLRKNPSLYTEREYYKYLDNLLIRITADLGYLLSIESWNPRPANIEGIYASKFNNLKSEYNTKAKQYIIERAQDEVERAAAIERAEQEAIERVLLEKQQYVQEIKVKVAEMDQLAVLKETLSEAAFIDVINDARKLDGDPLFYTLQYGNSWYFYPYKQDLGWRGNGYLNQSFNSIIANYKAFLYVELAKNQ